jgi:PTH1 family peptidyl-tRNA hydrolase
MKKYLIAGLGNIGSDYVNTRHNIGFKILDAIAETENLNYEDRKLGKIARFKIKGRQVLLLKPNTYMNLSGKAVKYWLDKENIPLENLLIITDDLNLPFDSIRLKTKGSAGGHNGLKDIQETLHTTQYNRFRFGISADFKKGRQVDYVLGTWSELEQDVLHKRLALTKKIIDSFILSGIQTAMNTYNGK